MSHAIIIKTLKKRLCVKIFFTFVLITPQRKSANSNVQLASLVFEEKKNLPNLISLLELCSIAHMRQNEKKVN